MSSMAIPLLTRVPYPNQPTPCFTLNNGASLKTSISTSGRSLFSPIQRGSSVAELSEQKKLRRSGNYQPPNWEFNFVQSLKTEYTGERYSNRCYLLKEQVNLMLLDEEEIEPLCYLELIDDLQRLGLSYHYRDKIYSILSRIHKENCLQKMQNEEDLYATSLAFRLLRQQGFDVPQEVFNCFKNEKGEFKPNLSKNTKGMLQLYEASYLLTQNESILELAREFAGKHLKMTIYDKGIDEQLLLLVEHALELPQHWRIQRLEARWFIDWYEKRPDMNSILLELAKLDFNLVQATHQNDLKSASSWWKSTQLAEKLTFARDRLVENFFWTIGVSFQPQYGYGRRMSTKVNALITTIDDVYDVFGTLDELQLFTKAVERWDTKEMDQLPDYMKICYFALFNTINEMAYDAMCEQGVQIVQYLRKAWTDLCKAYLQEAKWYFTGYMPKLQEYLDNAWISISAPVILVHAYFSGANPITKEALECLDEYSNIIRCSAMILRLADDLGTSSDELKRGDVPKSVQCYMKEANVSEEEAREYIKFLIYETWKQMNKERVTNSSFPQTFIEVAMNLGRMAQCMYQHGDGHGYSNPSTKDRIEKLLFEPVALNVPNCFKAN